MKTSRKRKCPLCGEWAICVWSTDPIRMLCEPCHAGLVLGERP